MRGRRDVGIAAIEIIAVHAATGRSPFGDRFRMARLRYVIDAEPAAEVGRAGLADLLVIDQHDPVRHPHLVRMPALRDIDGC